MTEAEFWELIRRVWEQGIPLNEAQKEAMREYLRSRMSPESIRAFERDWVPRRRPPPRPWWRRLFSPKNLRFGGYAALLYLLVAAIHDGTVGPPPISSGSGPCNPGAGTVSLYASPSRPGPNSALKAAMEELETQCSRSGLACGVGGSCPTCAPDVAVQTAEIKTRIFWYTTEVTATCQCWCQ